MEAMRRYTIINQEQAALVELMRTGHITDDIWHDFKVSQDETVAEIKEIIEEANTYTKDWGTTIFKSAGQRVHLEKQTEESKEIESMREREEKRWAMELQNEQLKDDMKNKDKDNKQEEIKN